jgi:hypothetical protein
MSTHLSIAPSELYVLYCLVLRESKHLAVEVNLTSFLLMETPSRRDGADKVVSTQVGNSL